MCARVAAVRSNAVPRARFPPSQGHAWALRVSGVALREQERPTVGLLQCELPWSALGTPTGTVDLAVQVVQGDEEHRDEWAV